MEQGGREIQEGGAYVHMQLTHFIAQQRLAKYGRANIIQLKKKFPHHYYYYYFFYFYFFFFFHIIIFKAKECQFISNLGLSGVPGRMRLIGNEDCPENMVGLSRAHSILCLAVCSQELYLQDALGVGIQP